MNVFVDLFNYVMEGDIEALKTQIESFPDFEVNSILDENGRSLLCGAIAMNNIQLIRYFIELGADLEHESIRGRCPQHFTKDARVLDELMHFGLNINKTDELGNTILTKGISKQDSVIILKCLEHGASIECDYVDMDIKPMISPLLTATSVANNGDVIKQLINRGANTNITDENGLSPLLSSLQSMQNFETVNLLVDNGANIRHIDNKGDNALLLALKVPNKEIVDYFLDKEFPVDYISESGDFPLKCASRNLIYGEAATRKLLTRGANVNFASLTDGLTALHLAASAGNTAVIAVLLENKANVNAQAVNGKTPLMYAVEKSNTNSTLLLLENGANALARDARDRTAAEYCCERQLQNVLQSPNGRKRRRCINVNQP